MTDLQFRALVREMLTAQQNYFKSRKQSDLIKAKDLEKKVLQELDADPKPRTLVDGSEPGEQYSLFE